MWSPWFKRRRSTFVPTGQKTPNDVRGLLFALLHDALITIRNSPLSGGESDELAYRLADWMHNWPNWLRDAQSDADYAEIWALSCEFCAPVVREWVRVMMDNYKVTPRQLGLPPV